VLLVGPASTSDGTAAARTASFNAGAYVVAPTVAISVPAGSVPGLSTAALTGRYAYWVGDESVKARVDLRDGYQTTAQTSDQINSFITPQRSAFEFMDRDYAATQLGSASASGFDFKTANVANVVAPSQLALAGTATAQANLSATVKARFHDLTTRSHGVLADVYAGGLKKDLTADIADPSVSGNNPAGDRKSDADPIFVPISASEANLPTWGHLRSWARLRPNGSGEVAPVPPSDTHAGVGPLPLYASLGMDLFIDGSKQLRMVFYPVVVLSNPYPFTLEAARYSIGFKFPSATRSLIRILPPNPADTTYPQGSHFTSAPVAGIIDWGQMTLVSGNATASPSPSQFASFVIAGMSIPPGESHIYRLRAPSGTYSGNDELERAATTSGGGIDLFRHVLLPTAVQLDASVVTTGTSSDSSHIRVESAVYNNDANNMPVEFVLAREGGLASAGDRFQSGRMLMRRAFGFAVGEIFDTKPTGRSGSTNIVAYWKNPGDVPFRARAALRYGNPLEHGGLYANVAAWGLPEGVENIWLRHGNFRAPFVQATRVENTAAGLRAGKDYRQNCGTTIIGMVMVNNQPPLIPAQNPEVALFPSYNGYAVNLSGHMDAGASAPPTRTVLFDLLKTEGRLLSLGQLQHVPFGRYSFYSAYPFGNSYADVRVDRTTTYKTGVVERPPSFSTLDPAYDLSWHLNRALWDRYFVSGVPAAWTQADVDAGRPLPDTRLRIASVVTPPIAELRYSGGINRAFDKAAAHLLVAGGFNINSTSEQAWRALLGASMGLPKTNSGDYAATTDPVDEIVPFPRFSSSLVRPAGSPYAATTTTMILDNSGNAFSVPEFRRTLYHGNRGLLLKTPVATPVNSSVTALVNELARTIVREIRTRGPFLSLADFVNRPVLGSKQDVGIKGALQSALDLMDTAQANPYRAPTVSNGVGNPVKDQATDMAYTGWDAEHFSGGPASERNTGRDSFRMTNHFSPKSLTQADLLSTLGPALTARADTFIVRTYGEVINPVTSQVEGRAWCEAVVQRFPEYVSPSATQTPDAVPTGDNITFGRKLKIVSYRWLSPSDI
jgi:hypothetical protein